MPRFDDRLSHELRPITIVRGFTRTSPGSVLISAGGTRVLCTASLANSVPDWMVGRGTGWLTAEYNMLPGSTSPRKKRERDGKIDGRTTEIQRLIGRSLRAVADLELLGERSLTVDCDVIEADGGTRTLSITGALIAAVDALQSGGLCLPGGIMALRQSVAAVSVGIVDGEVLTDLNYREDVRAEVDMNVVMTGNGQFVEVQGTGEESTFSEDELAALLRAAKQSIRELTAQQEAALGSAWPWPLSE